MPCCWCVGLPLLETAWRRASAKDIDPAQIPRQAFFSGGSVVLASATVARARLGTLAWTSSRRWTRAYRPAGGASVSCETHGRRSAGVSAGLRRPLASRRTRCQAADQHPRASAFVRRLGAAEHGANARARRALGARESPTSRSHVGLSRHVPHRRHADRTRAGHPVTRVSRKALRTPSFRPEFICEGPDGFGALPR
jgi:hypothetical protein